jgi:hypothetical protein
LPPAFSSSGFAVLPHRRKDLRSSFDACLPLARAAYRFVLKAYSAYGERLVVVEVAEA